MSDSPQAPEGTPDKKPPKKAPAGKPATPPRDLPSQEQIAAWVRGDDLPTLSFLFDQLITLRFDALVMQIRKAELLPQHWQVISQREIADPGAFAGLPAVRRLREGYGDAEAGRNRIAALEVGWTELGGKQPSLWTVADLFVVLRRVIDRKLDVDFNDLLSGARDVWRGQTLPHGRNQLDELWACLSFVRTKTKK